MTEWEQGKGTIVAYAIGVALTNIGELLSFPNGLEESWENGFSRERFAHAHGKGVMVAPPDYGPLKVEIDAVECNSLAPWPTVEKYLAKIK